ncbi:hypothetical protein ACFO6R_10930 [Eubacterium multiforme]|uniref:Lipoprotein n=1 Tax=Eubacterium multiforme TaxID=83339 RepID=A0ABT9UVK7_9FIRM|nr:hypothetical protein [Eubacterium multiforme]MDQ0150309.1 hypothetical protein [Eubacterium multiforme]
MKKLIPISLIILIILLFAYKIYSNIPSIPYEAKSLNLTIKFPKSLTNKYIIKESKNSLSVYFKPQKSNNLEGFLFIIANANDKSINHAEYDSIDSKKYITIKNKKYFIGGPTDIGFPDDNSEYSTYKNMKDQVPKIINSIK